jgi:hypothetical protein
MNVRYSYRLIWDGTGWRGFPIELFHRLPDSRTFTGITLADRSWYLQLGFKSLANTIQELESTD